MKNLNAIRAWLGGHKKLTATIVAAIVSLLPSDLLDEHGKERLVAILVAFVVGQGVADAGKEKAKLEAGRSTPNPAHPSSTQP